MGTLNKPPSTFGDRVELSTLSNPRNSIDNVDDLHRMTDEPFQSRLVQVIQRYPPVIPVGQLSTEFNRIPSSSVSLWNHQPYQTAGGDPKSPVRLDFPFNY